MLRPDVRSLHGIREGAVGVAAHRDVIIDVDQFSRKAACEESRDEQGDIAEPLQSALPRRGARRIQRLGEHVRERLDAQSIRSFFVQRIGARKHGEEVDDVLLGLFVDVEVLVFARCVKRVTEELAQGTDGYQRSIGHCLHVVSLLPNTTPSYRQCTPEVKRKKRETM